MRRAASVISASVHPLVRLPLRFSSGSGAPLRVGRVDALHLHLNNIRRCGLTSHAVMSREANGVDQTSFMAIGTRAFSTSAPVSGRARGLKANTNKDGKSRGGDNTGGAKDETERKNEDGEPRGPKQALEEWLAEIERLHTGGDAAWSEKAKKALEEKAEKAMKELREELERLDKDVEDVHRSLVGGADGQPRVVKKVIKIQLGPRKMDSGDEEPPGHDDDNDNKNNKNWKITPTPEPNFIFRFINSYLLRKINSINPSISEEGVLEGAKAAFPVVHEAIRNPRVTCEAFDSEHLPKFLEQAREHEEERGEEEDRVGEMELVRVKDAKLIAVDTPMSPQKVVHVRVTARVVYEEQEMLGGEEESEGEDEVEKKKADHGVEEKAKKDEGAKGSKMESVTTERVRIGEVKERTAEIHLMAPWACFVGELEPIESIEWKAIGVVLID